MFKRRLKRKGFSVFDIEVHDEVYDKFSEMALLFAVQETPDRDILEEMKIHHEKTDRKIMKRKKGYWEL